MGKIEQEFAERGKARVREVLAAQPHRVYPSFDDLLAAVDAIFDYLADPGLFGPHGEPRAW